MVYRLEYHASGDGSSLASVTPHYVGSLQGGFQGYWPNLFSDGSGLYVIGSTTDVVTAADISQAADPAGDGSVTQGPTLTIPGLSNATYPVYQDQFGFIHNRKINMTEFLGGNPDPVVLTLDEIATGVNTSQMSLPLGNLWITGGYPIPGFQQGMAVWVQQQAPDTTPPAVTYHIPQANRTNYPRFAPLSFLLHEHPRHGGMRNGIDFTVRPVNPDESLGAAVPGFLIHDFAGVVTFTPTDGLIADTTYQVDFLSDTSDPANPIGFFDAAGNPIEPYSFRFSTGGGISATTPPVLNSLSSDDFQPAPGQNFTVTIDAIPGTGGGPLEYRYNFDGNWSAWTPDPFAGHAYAEVGRYRILIQVRDASGNQITQPLNLLVLDSPAGPAPTRSATLAIGADPAGRRIWSVNPDADSVSVTDAATGALVAEHPVGDHPRNIARDALGRYWVTCQDSDEIHVLNPDGTPAAVLARDYGDAPFGIAPSPDGNAMFATLHGAAALLRYDVLDLAASPTQTASPFPTPRALAVSGDGQRVLVTRFISDELQAEIAEFDGLATGLDHVRTITLAAANTLDGGDRAAGVPNYLTGIAISPDGTRAVVVSKQDNTQRGLAYGVADLTFETTVRSVLSLIDLQTNAEIPNARRDFDNSDSPSDVAFTPLGDTLLVTLQGNNRLVGLDALNLAPISGVYTTGTTLTSPVIKTLEAETELAPQSLLIDPVSLRIVTQNFMSRSLTLLDAAPLLNENRTQLPLITHTAVVTTEPLPADVLFGKQIFYNAGDPRMSAEGYISCATCHLDGGSDGRIWDFTGRGEGLRRTTDLRGRAGVGHGNVHWSGNFDEIHDFEHDIRGPFGGTGFLPLSPTEFANQHPSPASAKTGLSADLDALAAYVASLATDSVPRSPHRQADGSMTAAGLRGRDVFTAQNCISCHGGDSFTSSPNTPVDTPTLQPVGTTSTSLSGQRLGQPLPGIDTPTLIGLHDTDRYLHHGQATSLDEVFTYTGGTLLLAAEGELVGDPAGLRIENENPGEGGGGFLRGALGGSLVHIETTEGNGVRFLNVDGGSGGPARLTIRHASFGGGNATIRVNGVEQSVGVLPQFPNSGWMLSGWRWLTVDVVLNAGAVNTIEILRGNGMYTAIQLNAILVSNTDDIAAAAAHRTAADLPTGDYQDLLSYLSQLDGSANEAPVLPNPDNPDVSIALAAGTETPLTAPFVDYTITFTDSVTGLTADDFLIGGSALPTVTNLITITEGTHYQLRVTGFTQSGNLTLELPAGSVDGAIAGSVNNVSNNVELLYTPPAHDDLTALSDEFNEAGSLNQWLRNDTAEGWNADKLETWDIDTSATGAMRFMPFSSSWYQDFTGAYCYKEVTGDFVVTIDLEVWNRAMTGRPNSDYSLTGLLIRTPRGLTNAAPTPDPGPGVVLPWPPDGSYTTPWQPGTENYIFLSYGFGTNGMPDSNPNRWHYEVKTTINGVSTLYPRTHGVPDNESNATLQIVRRGQTFLLLRRHGGGPWIIENRFVRPDMPATLQVGITTYTDWNTVADGWDYSDPTQPFHQNRIVNDGIGNPDLIADVDYFRIRRPDAALDEATLAAVPVTGQNGPVVNLAGSAAAPYLGDGPATPVAPLTFVQWLGQHLAPQELADPSLTTPDGHAWAGNPLPNILHYMLGGAPATPPAITPVDDGAGGTELRYLVPRNPTASGWQLIIETSTNLSSWTTVATSQEGAFPTGAGVEGEIPGDTPTMVIGPGEPDGVTRFYRTTAEPVP